MAFGFVFIHPFEDGNGRIHRFIIHYIFAKTGFVPNGVIFPISATILKDMATYDSILGSFSKPLLVLIDDFEQDSQGQLTVKNRTCSHYRFLDYTRFAEFLFECVEKTIFGDFRNELSFLVHYDKTKKALSEIVDMPDKKLDLFIQCVLQNHGALSAKKREGHFPMLQEAELERMQEVVRREMIL